MRAAERGPPAWLVADGRSRLGGRSYALSSAAATSSSVGGVSTSPTLRTSMSVKRRELPGRPWRAWRHIAIAPFTMLQEL